jgi:ferritin-like metal-binding protein YciE
MKNNSTSDSQTYSEEISSNGNTSTSEQKNGKTIKDVFEEELKDIYWAEKYLVKSLPKVIKAAYSEELKDAITDHLEETKEQVKRIEKIFSMLGLDREAKKCEAMEGLVQEAESIIEEFEEGDVRDCALIIGSQKIEHYEIAAYGSLCELAEVMGKHRVAEMLDESLEEEEGADSLLTEIAEVVNDNALENSEEEIEY